MAMDLGSTALKFKQSVVATVGKISTRGGRVLTQKANLTNTRKSTWGGEQLHEGKK